MPCPGCGAPRQRGLTCREQWEELLALEFSDLRAGRVHFLTVACYQLQHPSSFALSPEATEQLRSALEDVVVHQRPVTAVRDEMQQAFTGSRRVRSAGSAETTPSSTWSVTVADLGAPDPLEHEERIHRWARAVLDDVSR